MHPLLPRHPDRKRLSLARRDEGQALLDAINRACDGPPDPEEEAGRRAMQWKQRRLIEQQPMVWELKEDRQNRTHLHEDPGLS